MTNINQWIYYIAQSNGPAIYRNKILPSFLFDAYNTPKLIGSVYQYYRVILFMYMLIHL